MAPEHNRLRLANGDGRFGWANRLWQGPLLLAGCVQACGYEDIAATRVATAGFDSGPAPFSDLRRLTELGDPEFDQEDPTLTSDELELYFGAPGNRVSKPRPGVTSRLFVSKRSKRSDTWGAPSEVVNLAGTSGTTFAPTIAPDGLTIWFTSDRPGGRGGLDIWTSTRTARDAGWEPPVNVAEVNAPTPDLDPGISPDLRILYFGRFGPDGRNHIWGSSRTLSTIAWEPPHEISELNSPASDGSASHDGDPDLTGGGLVLYWGSSRDVAGGSAIAHLYRASRPSTSSAFSTIVALSELNTQGFDDQDPWTSADERHIVFSSDREGLGYHHLYEAWRR